MNMKSGHAIEQVASMGQGLSDQQIANLSELILGTCGIERMLDVTADDDRLLAELLRVGVDAHRLIAPGSELSHAPAPMSDRLKVGRLSSLLPFDEKSFACVICTGGLEDLGEEELDRALGELHRVTSRSLFLSINAGRGDGVTELRQRAWWESRFFAKGFRKHPAYYWANSYESLNNEGATFSILLEKMPDAALQRYPLSALAEERNLHMDMTREVGERSDAHIIRYQWAANYIRPGDRVLDAACGLGYGSNVLSYLTEAKKITGVDGSAYAIDYGNASFAETDPRVEYREGYLPQALADYPDGSFDAIVSFETLEHVEDPVALIAEFTRLLSPGGRLIVSVPNDWSDETGEDPNPFHLHVYDWLKLKGQLAKDLLIEHAFAQTASSYKVAGTANTWQRAGRSLYQLDDAAESGPESEWLLFVAMKSPLDATQPFRESIYGYTAPPKNLLAFERDYRNPWLVRSLVEFPFRAKNPRVLREIAEGVLSDRGNDGFPDEGAALAVIGYQELNGKRDRSELISRIERYIESANDSPHSMRWRISLSYLLAQFHKNAGNHRIAVEMLTRVANADCSMYSPTLGTKIVDAAYQAGVIHASYRDVESARRLWMLGVKRAFELISAPPVEFLGDMEAPRPFSVADIVEMVDSANRSVKALRWTSEDGSRPQARLFEQSRQNWKWMIDGRERAMRALESLVRERDVALSDSNVALSERNALLDHQAFAISARDEAILSQTAMIDDRDAAIRSQTAMIDERDALLQAQSRLIEDRDKALHFQARVMQQRDDELQTLRQRLEERETSLVGKQVQLIQQEVELDQLRASFVRRERSLFLRVWRRLRGRA